MLCLSAITQFYISQFEHNKKRLAACMSNTLPTVYHSSLFDKRRHCRVHEINLVLVDGMPHVGIQTSRHLAAQLPKNISTFQYPLFGNMEINIAATQENWRASQRARIVARGIIRADQSATQAEYTAITLSVASGKFG